MNPTTLSNSSNKPFVSGIVPPTVTPLLDYNKLDGAGLERLIEHILAGGVSGLFVLGTTGEGTALGEGVRREVIHQVCAQTGSRVPVLVCVSDTALERSIELARFAAKEGASATVISPSFHMPSGQAELRAFLAHFIAETTLPVLLYHMPPLTRIAFELETLRWATEQPRVVGVKDSSGDLAFFRELCGLLPRRPDWTLMIGSEELLAQSVPAGGRGGIPGGANAFPRLYVELYEAARRNDTAKAQLLQGIVLQVCERLFRRQNHPAAMMKGLKCALAALGICSDVMAEPFRQLDETSKAEVRAAAKELEVLVANATR